MKDDLRKANEVLENAIKNGGIDENELYELSKEVDKLLAQQYNENHNSLLNKYKYIIEREDKREILKIIKMDLLGIYQDICFLELELLANNVYDCCCLLAKQTPKEEILKYITQKNELYYNNLIKEDRKKLRTPAKIDIEELQPFIKKYTYLFCDIS